MKDDEFTKLFKYMQDFRAEVNERLDDTAKKSDVDNLRNTMDDFIRQLTNTQAEQSARDAQWNRLLEWAREVSKKTGVPLPDL
ncbi:MAG: hypothetical protein WAS27_03485 [Candidatus Saccharimonadales bacterium]